MRLASSRGSRSRMALPRRSRGGGRRSQRRHPLLADGPHSSASSAISFIGMSGIASGASAVEPPAGVSAPCVVHLVRAANGIEPFRAFLESYVRHPAGLQHELVLLFKGFSSDREAAS